MERDPVGWADLDVSQIEDLEGEEFERFCSDLIAFEVYDRHDDAQYFGPAGKYVRDGGSDIFVSVRKPPFTTKRDYRQIYNLGPLTEDALGQTAYSCKSGAAPVDLAIRDLKRRKEPGRAVDVLLNGGHFKLFIPRAAKVEDHARLVGAFWERTKMIEPSAGDPSDRIQILDAHAIVNFLRSRRPPSGAVMRWAEQRFQLSPVLHDIEEWRAQHRKERDEPSFKPDRVREVIHAELLDFLRSTPADPEARAAWLVGPPGVGKTRLLLEKLAHEPSVAQRVRIAFRPDEALAALTKERLAARHRGVVLVVDDCPAGEVDDVADRFLWATRDDLAARIVVITPASRSAFEKAKLARRWFLPPLEQRAAEALAGDVLDEPAAREQIERIAALSQGYPWFTALLAREARGEGRLPADFREAMFWALASRSEVQEASDLEELRVRRARCLVAATLTADDNWDRLQPEQQDSIAKAVGLEPWAQVVHEAQKCFERGILRRNLGWSHKYVTPFVLERELLAWFFDIDGPDPGGSGLSRLDNRYRTKLYLALERLGLPPGAVTALTEAGLARLGRLPAGLAPLLSSNILGPELRFLTRHAPREVARDLGRRIAASSLDALRAEKHGRFELVLALRELVSRRETFEEAEAALFRLARAENESWANNATQTWASIFLVELNATHRSLDERMSLLRDRCAEADGDARAVALLGLETVITTWATRDGREALDGAWPEPTPGEAHRARAGAWSLLTARFADADPQVAGRAKQIAFEELRGAVRSGVGAEALASIAEQIVTLGDGDRMKLREALAAVRAYDGAWLDATARPALQRVEDLLSPASYGERLRQHVGTFGPIGARSEASDRAADEVLADEGLSGDVPLLAELDWLVSDQAKRAHVFADVLGERDRRGLLAAGLRLRAKDWQKLWRARVVFARYLGGWARGGSRAEAKEILRDLQREPEDAPVAVLALIELGATDEDVAWLRRALSTDRVDGAAVMELGRLPKWLAGVSENAFCALVDTLIEGVDLHQPAAAIEMLLDHVKEAPARAESLSVLLLRGLERLAPERLAGMIDYRWELGAQLLVQEGHAGRIAELAVVALTREVGSSDHAWNALHAAAERDPGAAWRAVAAALDKRDAAAGRLVLSFWFHRQAFPFPAEDVLAWVGNDARRARAVVNIIRSRSDDLDPVLRALLQRFGAWSPVANDIISRIHSTDGAVASIADHDARQLQRARRWLTDPEPHVRNFARRLVESLEQRYEQHAAHEEAERRRFGT